ncbi:268_t:CDS:2, partial [Entrophospora sp. SA101]
KIAIWFKGVKRIDNRKDLVRYPKLAEIVRTIKAICRHYEMPMPEVGIYPSREINAFATGRPRDSLIAISTGLIKNFTDEEIKGVLAHEISHLMHKDLRFILLVQGFCDLVVIALSTLAFALAAAPRKDEEETTMIVCLTIRKRELKADRKGAEIIGTDRMIATLQKLLALEKKEESLDDFLPEEKTEEDDLEFEEFKKQSNDYQKEPNSISLLKISTGQKKKEVKEIKEEIHKFKPDKDYSYTAKTTKGDEELEEHERKMAKHARIMKEHEKKVREHEKIIKKLNKFGKKTVLEENKVSKNPTEYEKTCPNCLNKNDYKVQPAKPEKKIASLGKIMGTFCREFNEKTKGAESGKIVNVKIKVFADGTYEFEVKGKITSDLIKKVAGEKKIISQAELKKIAEMQLPYLNTEDLAKAQKTIAGTAKSAEINPLNTKTIVLKSLLWRYTQVAEGDINFTLAKSQKRERDEKNDYMNIYQKIFAIQQDPKMAKLVRTELNKFQNYRYFTESQILAKLRPLLKEQGLILLFSDNKEQGFAHEKTEKEHVVKYIKKVEIIDIAKPENRITEEF